MNIIKRTFAFLIAAALGFSLFAACSTEDDTPKGDVNLDKTIVATIEGVNVTQADYNLIYKTIYDQLAQYEQYYGEDWITMPVDGISTFGDYIRRNADTQVKTLVIAEILAEEMYGIKSNDEKVKKAVDKQYKEFKAQFGSNEAYNQFLSTAKTTDAAVKKSVQRSEILVRLQEKATAKGEVAYVPEDETLEAFKAEKVRVQHILISTQEQTDSQTGAVTEARTDAEAQKIVNEILAKLAKGENFDKLIDEYDEDPGMESGKFYVFGPGEMVAEFEEASFNLKVGEYTKQGVKTSYGYHIIKKYDIDKDVEEFKAYKSEQEQIKLSDIITAKADELDIRWETEALDKYVFEWINEMRKAKGLNPLEGQELGINIPTEEETDAGNTDTKESDAETSGEEKTK